MSQERCAWCLSQTSQALTGSHGICQMHADQLYARYKQEAASQMRQKALVTTSVKTQQVSNNCKKGDFS